MLEVWAWGSNSKGISTAVDTRALSLNVLAAMGGRKSYKFCGLDRAGVDKAGSYRDALQPVLDNAILIMNIPFNYLTLSFMPRSWNELVRLLRSSGSIWRICWRRKRPLSKREM